MWPRNGAVHRLQEEYDMNDVVLYEKNESMSFAFARSYHYIAISYTK